MAGTAFAQSIATRRQYASGAAGFPVGPLNVFPGIDLAHGYDDNLFLEQQQYEIIRLHGREPLRARRGQAGPHKFDVTLRITNGHYWSSSADNYTDYSLIGNGDMVFSGRAGLKLRAEFRHGHDPRGSTDRAATSTPDQYNNYGLDGVFRYGAPGAQGRIEIDAGAFARRYTNNRATTDVSNHNTSRVGGTFFWRVMPRTELLVAGAPRRHQLPDDSPPSTQDSTENRYLRRR